MIRKVKKMVGCVCIKGVRSNEGNSKDRGKKLRKSSKRSFGSFKKEENVAEPEGAVNEATTRLISSPTGVETENEYDRRESGAVNEKSPENLHKRGGNEGSRGGVHRQVQHPGMGRVGSFSTGGRGAQVVAGWPSWLSSVAGEAINGWIPRRADSFEKLEKIGQGTYSSVYRARDLETDKIVALKKVRFANMDPESVRFMAREIIILRRLDHPNVMKLEGLISSRVSGSLYLIFEYMEHDLAGLSLTPGVKFTESQIKCYMQQLLSGLEHCHSHGVLHRDIKGANLLIDNNGCLKIADFGLAAFLQPNQKQPLTSRVVTLWYRPPELLLGSTDYGPSIDLWSSGCILAELFSGKPIMPGRTEVEQLHKIFKLCGSPSDDYWKSSKLQHATVFKPQQPYKRVLRETFKDFPSSALALLEILLSIEPEFRGSASSALQNEFFTTNPLPLDPSSLPKYPPSKEFDAKLRDEEARRQKAANKGNGNELVKKNSIASRAVPAPDANAELQASIQKRRGERQPNSMSTSEKFTGKDDVGAGFPMDPSKAVASNAPSHSGNGHDQSKPQRTYIDKAAARLSRFSNSVAVRGSSRFNGHRETVGRYDRLDGGESSVKPEWSHHLLDRFDSSYNQGTEALEDSTKSYSPRKNQIHYSGPLMGPGGNLDEILKEHERKIQQAVRKARLDKAKTNREYTQGKQMESVLLYGKNGR
ncbi:hypothetical protein SAY86_000976 [Trapa natans]|uniref:Protein kinase domain-containing protein n=1 Tax=Trapa natans TaxID=22666 RepID=A0AAN7RNG2_TRANT|nr:hypothetical protein SAY86_000976 [Trapa natans]